MPSTIAGPFSHEMADSPNGFGGLFLCVILLDRASLCLCELKKISDVLGFDIVDTKGKMGNLLVRPAPNNKSNVTSIYEGNF